MSRGTGAAEEELIHRVEMTASQAGFELDAAQDSLLARLATLGASLANARATAPRGVYVHGGPGRGKSWLAGAFYTALPPGRKRRIHVHGFFDDLHRRIQSHRSEHDAVDRAIEDIASDNRLLYFDELHVHDSGDARLMTRLLQNVFARRITVLATSNYAPEDLLPNPVWHHTMEAGIALISDHMDAWHLDGGVDYRDRNHTHSFGFASGRWRVERDESSPEGSQGIDVDGRRFVVTSADEHALVATFDQLCVSATSTIEYLRWARDFPRWAITRIPAFSSAPPDAQQRFINLVDVLVDQDVPVDFSSEKTLAGFLSGASGRPDAFRMASRLSLLDTCR